MLTRKILSGAVLASAVLAAPVQAKSFLVEQYDVYLGTSLAAYQDYAANNEADYEAYVDYIDFTDDPNGFAGHIDGSNPWPGEVATGLSGTSSWVNQTFFARITANFVTSVADTFTFRTFNDDGVFLMVNGELVISDGSLHPERQFTGVTSLASGRHSLEIFFFENGGEASLEFSFAGQNQAFSLTGGPNVTSISAVPLPASGVVLGSALVAGAVARRRARGKA